MKRSDRPGLFSKDRSRAYYQRKEAIAKLMLIDGMTDAEARAHLREKAKHYRDQNWPYERCGARNRQGLPCKAQALRNGRCKNHGGMSTGPRTLEGKEVALSKLKQFR